MPDSLFDGSVKQEQEKWDNLKYEWYENAYLLHKELGEWMTDNVTVVRDNDRLKKTDEKILELWNVMKISISMIRLNGATKVLHLLVNLKICFILSSCYYNRSL